MDPSAKRFAQSQESPLHAKKAKCVAGPTLCMDMVRSHDDKSVYLTEQSPALINCVGLLHSWLKAVAQLPMAVSHFKWRTPECFDATWSFTWQKTLTPRLPSQKACKLLFRSRQCWGQLFYPWKSLQKYVSGCKPSFVMFIRICSLWATAVGPRKLVETVAGSTYDWRQFDTPVAEHDWHPDSLGMCACAKAAFSNGNGGQPRGRQCTWTNSWLPQMVFSQGPLTSSISVAEEVFYTHNSLLAIKHSHTLQLAHACMQRKFPFSLITYRLAMHFSWSFP